MKHTGPYSRLLTEFHLSKTSKCLLFNSLSTMDEDDSKQSKFWLFYKSSKVCEKCERNTNMPVMLRCFNEAQLRQLPEEDPSVSRHHTDPECLSHTVCTAKPPDTCLEWFIMSQFCSKGQALGLSFITLQAYHTIVSAMWCFKCLLHWIQSQCNVSQHCRKFWCCCHFHHCSANSHSRKRNLRNS